MRFEEGCKVFMIETYAKAGLGVEDIVKALIEISKRIPVYIVLHPSIVTVGLRGLKRGIAVAAGSAIICSEDIYVDGLNFVELAEPTWIDVGILIPYIRGDVVESARTLGLEVRRDIGLRSVVVHTQEDQRKLIDIIEGGIAFLVNGEDVEGEVRIAPRMNKLFLFMKTLKVKGVCRARIARLELEPRTKFFMEELVDIGKYVAVAAMGKGYLVTFEPMDTLSRHLFAVTIFAGLVTPVNTPIARAYTSMLETTR